MSVWVSIFPTSLSTLSEAKTSSLETNLDLKECDGGYLHTTHVIWFTASWQVLYLMIAKFWRFQILGSTIDSVSEVPLDKCMDTIRHHLCRMIFVKFLFIIKGRIQVVWVRPPTMSSKSPQALQSNLSLSINSAQRFNQDTSWQPSGPSLLRLQMIKTIVNSCRFKGSSSDEPRRVQVLDLYCLTRFESEGSGGGDVY